MSPKTKLLTIGIGAVIGAVTGTILAFNNKRKRIESANTRRLISKKPKGFQTLSLAIISHVHSVSPELGDWLLSVNLSNNGHGWYPCPKDPQWMKIHFGFTSVALMVEKGRVLMIRLGDDKVLSREYPIDGRIWEKLSEEMVFQKTI